MFKVILLCAVVISSSNGLPDGHSIMETSLTVTDDGPAVNGAPFIVTVKYSTRAKHRKWFDIYNLEDADSNKKVSARANDIVAANFTYHTDQNIERRNLRVEIFDMDRGFVSKMVARIDHAFVVCKYKPSGLRVTSGWSFSGSPTTFEAFYSLGNSSQIFLFQFNELGNSSESAIFAHSNGERASTSLTFFTGKWVQQKAIKVTVWFGDAGLVKMDEVIHHFTVFPVIWRS